MRALTRKWTVALSVASVGVLVFAVNAFAAAGDPPTFSASTLTAPFNDFGTAVLAGIVTLIGVVLVIRTPFALVNIGMKAVKRLFGSGKPTAS
jgi:hypothetical protein